MTSRFDTKKRKILALLEIPDEEYHDLSPKGSVDEPIRPLIRDINRLPGLVTTSSCSGRVSVFAEGKKNEVLESELDQNGGVVRAGPGGKGSGSWLYVSHSPIEVSENAQDLSFLSMFGLKPRSSHALGPPTMRASYIHLKFEPMILHILTASLDDSQRVLTAALSAGFRESGAVSLSASKSTEANPIVAVRSTGYSFDAIIGYQDEQGENIALVDEAYLQTLVAISNERFQVNEERISRFRSALLNQYDRDRIVCTATPKPDWEDAETRRQRKRQEGLARKKQLEAQKTGKSTPYSPDAHEHLNYDLAFADASSS